MTPSQPTTATKACGRCRRQLPLTDFSRQTGNNVTGLQSYCRSCATDYWRDWDHRRRHPPSTPTNPDKEEN